ncbi:tRNA pseudouridine(55) synthase TruB [Candidatus Saccharibacteria bacterium]|nr:tRNA pseudouridine(55) synthase TruB [Candidatus Saccharibacteria bacterium]
MITPESNDFQPGIYLINKPRGRSSFSMVAQVRRLSGIKKVGHAGTLDPEAEGLLIILVGKDYTKQSDSYLKLDKTYEFTVKLGETSDTGDEEGKKTVVSKEKPTQKAILDALEIFTGEIEQVPPQYSAIKINGVRAYKLARKGEVAEISSRQVTISSLDLLEYNFPYVTLEANVSSGTYIRSLAEDLGKKLGTGAYCTQIIRTRIGESYLKDAVTLD